MDKYLFKGMNAWSQIFFFCSFAFIGYIVAILLTSIVSLFLFKGVFLSELMQSATFIRLSQMIAAVCVFLIPSLLFTRIFYKGSHFLKQKNSISFLLILGVTILMFILQPGINIIGHFNQQIVLPDFMASVEDWMRSKEKSSESIVNICFADKSIGGYIGNLLIIAVLAGIVEEFFFRGCLQQVLEKIVLNKHIAIWVTAFVFSAVHLQFYGFFPRLLLGAMLGYLFVWTGSIWAPVLAHVLNNAIVVVLTQVYIGTPQYEDIRKIGVEDSSLIGISSIVGSLFLLFFIYKINKARVNSGKCRIKKESV